MCNVRKRLRILTCVNQLRCAAQQLVDSLLVLFVRDVALLPELVPYVSHMDVIQAVNVDLREVKQLIGAARMRDLGTELTHLRFVHVSARSLLVPLITARLVVPPTTALVVVPLVIACRATPLIRMWLHITPP